MYGCQGVSVLTEAVMKKTLIIAICISALLSIQTRLSTLPQPDQQINRQAVQGVLNPPPPPNLKTAAAHGNRTAKVLVGVCAVLIGILTVGCIFPIGTKISWPNR